MRQDFTVYHQGASPWGPMKLGTSGLTVAQAGCFVACCAMVLRSFFKKETDPGKLTNSLNDIGGILGNGQMSWTAFDALYPDTHLYDYKYTTNTPGWQQLAGVVTPEKAVKDIQNRVVKGLGVIIHVNLVPGGSDPDHAVVALETPDDLDAWTIADPAFGDVVRFKDRYGPVLTGVKGYRGIVGTTASFPDYAGPGDKASGIAAGLLVDDRYTKRAVLDALLSG